MRLQANDTQRRFEEQLKNELGELGDDSNIAPAVKGTKAEARAEEARRQREEHKKNLARMKAAGKKKTTKARVGGFDRSKLNPNFMGNTKTAKDKVAGWAFDFDNPDSGTGGSGLPVDSAMVGDDADM